MSANAERAALVYARGFTRDATASVNVVATAGGTALTASLSSRSYIEVFVPADAAGTVYLSTGTPTSTNHFAALVAGQSWGGWLGASIALTGLSSSGTQAVKVLELGTPL